MESMTTEQFDRTRRLALRLAGIELFERHREILDRRSRRLGLDDRSELDALLDGAEGGAGPKVLILTTFDLDEYVYEALRAGASGFMLKDTPPERLVEAIRVVAGGDALLSPTITRRVIEEFLRRPPASARVSPPELEELTTRELEMLRYIARGLSNAEIGQKLYISDATVKTHITHILQKLGLRDRVQVVVVAHEAGMFSSDVPGPA